MSLVLPPHVQKRIDLERRAEFEAAILRCTTIEVPLAQEWTRKLQHISPDLFMVKAHDTVDADLPLRPGFYHILVRNRDAPLSVMEVNDGGEFAEPDSRIFDVLAKGNLRERRVRERLERNDRDYWEQADREREEGKARRMERAMEIVDSATKVRVSMNDSVPWSQNASGRRGHK